MSSKKWNPKEGIQYDTDHTLNTELDAIKPKKRHIAIPNQASVYRSRLKALELRNKARNSIGNKLNMHDFHQVVISHKAIPLSVLEDFVDVSLLPKIKMNESS
tara:strand:+ start:396 stop:704 length:309 start_codon:yes stop_codon:yes gene_type:complete